MTSVLLVAPSPHVAATLVPWLTEVGCEVSVVASFAAGKARLEHVSLLISELRLGDYNGLHLAIRARSRDIPAIILGEWDIALQREAEDLGVVYVAGPVNRNAIVNAVDGVLHTGEPGTEPLPARTNVSFVSWDELVPALAARNAAERRRRNLRS